MSKIVIALDLDDVVVESGAHIVDAYNKRWGSTLALTNYYTQDLSQWEAPDDETAIQRVNAITEAKEFFELRPMQESIAAIRSLDRHYKLCIITGRPDIIATATLRWLDAHFPDIFADVIFSNMYDVEKVRDKGELCVTLGAEVLIDDHLSHIISAASKGVKGVLFGDYPWNQSAELPAHVTRCKDWAAVLEYFDDQRG